jgi:hypothetical protein
MHSRLLISTSFILALLLCVMLLHAETSKKIFYTGNNGMCSGKTKVVLANPEIKANTFLPSLLMFLEM